MAGTPSVIARTLLFLLALGVSSMGARAQTTECDVRTRTLKINDVTLHYWECGKGDPLVFVHGGLGDLHTFRQQAQAFATRFRVIAYSRRFSPPNEPAQATDANPMSMHVSDLRMLITQLEAAPAHLVGNSYGAFIALALAMRHPELVRSLVLGEPPVLSLLSSTSVGEAVRQSFVRRAVEPARKAFKAGNLEDGLRTFENAICGSPCFDKRSPSDQKERVEKIGPELRAGFITEPSAYLPPLGCDEIGKLRRPTLLVTGERSPAMFFLITAELERCLEGESQVMVPGAGHGIHSDNPTFYNEAVLGFLQKR